MAPTLGFALCAALVSALALPGMPGGGETGLWALAVSFQYVVHPDRTKEAEVARLQCSTEDRTNIHRNARLTPIGRERLVKAVMGGQTPEAAERAAGAVVLAVTESIVFFGQGLGAALGGFTIDSFEIASVSFARWSYRCSAFYLLWGLAEFYGSKQLQSRLAIFLPACCDYAILYRIETRSFDI